ncbi:MAG: hypothetical protein NUV76_02505 [Candidatus Kuenenia sp.]|nr:hypothetical protein [Candidatus Kuenenia sp.]
MGTDLEKVKIKEVRIFSSTGRHEHDRVFKVGVYGLDQIKYEYDPLNQTYSLNLYEKKATGERFHAATLYKADYIGFDPVEIIEDRGVTPAIQGDIETLREMAHCIGTIRIRDLLTNLEQECWERHGAHD